MHELVAQHGKLGPWSRAEPPWSCEQHAGRVPGFWDRASRLHMRRDKSGQRYSALQIFSKLRVLELRHECTNYRSFSYFCVTYPAHSWIWKSW
jgi:hypothetical protein